MSANSDSEHYDEPITVFCLGIYVPMNTGIKHQESIEFVWRVKSQLCDLNTLGKRIVYITKFILPVAKIIQSQCNSEPVGIAVVPSSKSEGLPHANSALMLLRKRLIDTPEIHAQAFDVNRSRALDVEERRGQQIQADSLILPLDSEINFPNRILVLDDVLTTGGTIRGVVQFIRDAYAQHSQPPPQIIAVVLKRTTRDLSRDPESPSGLHVILQK